MICCAALSLLIAAMIWFLRPGVESSPLEWRLHSQTPRKPSPRKRVVRFSAAARLKSLSLSH